MKFRVFLILLVMALAASSAVTAHARECKDSTIKGTYAFTIHGQILTPNGPLLVDGIAKTTFDGQGQLTQVSAVAINGNIPLIWSPSTGTYTVNSDCTGTMTQLGKALRKLTHCGHPARLYPRARQRYHELYQWCSMLRPFGSFACCYRFWFLMGPKMTHSG